MPIGNLGLILAVQAALNLDSRKIGSKLNGLDPRGLDYILGDYGRPVLVLGPIG